MRLLRRTQTVSFTKTRANATTSVSLITYKGPDQGEFAVTIDGVSVGSVGSLRGDVRRFAP